MLKLVSPLGAARAAARLLNRRASFCGAAPRPRRTRAGRSDPRPGLPVWTGGRAARRVGAGGGAGPGRARPTATDGTRERVPTELRRRRQAAGRADFSIDD